MKHKKKTVLKWICGILVVLLILLAAGGWWMFGTFITAANSIEKLEDGLYSMEYDGDYGFDDFLDRGGAASDSALADYLVSFLSRVFTKLKMMCRPVSLAALLFAHRMSKALFFSGAITTGKSARL